jgi:hypothetical protein
MIDFAARWLDKVMQEKESTLPLFQLQYIHNSDFTALHHNYFLGPRG